MSSRQQTADSRWTTAVPVIVDDVKRYVDFPMVRCTYFSIECDDLLPGWTLRLSNTNTPFTMITLSGIVVSPPTGQALFLRRSDFDALFRIVEEVEQFYVDINDIWIPLRCFGRVEPIRASIFRVGLGLLEQAFAYRHSRIDTDALLKASREMQGDLRESTGESEAFRAWSAMQIDESRARYLENEEDALRWTEDESLGDDEED